MEKLCTNKNHSCSTFIKKNFIFWFFLVGEKGGGGAIVIYMIDCCLSLSEHYFRTFLYQVFSWKISSILQMF
jgi:hypothetical protein